MREQALFKIPPHQAIWMFRGAAFAGLLSVAFTLWGIKAGVLGPGELAFPVAVLYFLGIVGIVALGPRANKSDANRPSQPGTAPS